MSRQAYTLSELAKSIDAECRGNGSCEIHGVASLASAKQGDVSFFANAQYLTQLSSTNASAVLLTQKHLSSCPTNALIVPNPQLGFVKLLEVFKPSHGAVPGIHLSAVIGSNCVIDPAATIGPNVVLGDRVVIGPRSVIEAGTAIGHGSKIGADCHLYSRLTLYDEVILGDRVIIHSGAVIGADGFGLVQDEQKNWVKIPQIGRVVIGNDVEIGANSTIDRGALDDTIIGNNVKLDNLVMIGHNCQIGDHTVIAGCAGIAGSTKVGKYCMIGASAGLNGHIEICDYVMITGFGMIQKSITKPGIYSSGTGMQTNQEWHRSVIRFWQLDELAKRLKRLERLCDEQNGN